MNIGDLVEPKNINLTSNSKVYPDAIIVSLNPFIIVSWQADMIWYNFKEVDFKKKRKAPVSIFTKCMDRFKKQI